MSQLIKLPEVINLTQLSETTVYRLAREGRFPKPIKLNPPNGRSAAWILSEVEQWIDDRIAASRDQEVA